MKNAIAGHGQHSHEVPSVPGLVVEIRDGAHDGTSVWRHADKPLFFFACHTNGTLMSAARCLLLAGQNVEDIGDNPYGCDLDSPRGLILLGCSADDDLSWLTEGATVEWDSNS